MNQLLPIVRRVRRPLVATESIPERQSGPPVVVGNVELVNAHATDQPDHAVLENAPANGCRILGPDAVDDTLDSIASNASPTAERA